MPQPLTVALQAVAGLGCLVLGAEMLVRGASALALRLGISALAVGLTVVAFGTSTPELVVSLRATLAGAEDIAVGNVVGSNIFNALVVLPAAGLISKVSVPDGGIGDLAASWVLAAVLIPVFFLGKARLGRGMGLLLLAAYGAYIAYRVFWV